MTDNKEPRGNNYNYFNDYDFLNFSFKQITNYEEGLKFGGTRGICFESNPEKYKKLLEEINDDETLNELKILKGNPSNIKINENTLHHFKFTTCIDFIEYLPGLEETRESILNAIKLSSDFVYISQDNFDSDVMLFKRGFKTNYSDWTKYINHLTSNIYFNILLDYFKLGYIEDYIIFYSEPIEDSNNQYIHPLNSSSNQETYDKNSHPYKNDNVKFTNIFHKLNVIITIKGYKNIDEIYEKIEGEKNIIYDSRNGIYEKGFEEFDEPKPKQKKNLFGKVNTFFNSND